MRLANATLQPAPDKDGKTSTETPFEVQFNPASLRLQRSNTAQGPSTPGRQLQTVTGSHATLTVELHFDTADAGTTGAPVSVLDQTRRIARFMTAGGAAGKKITPPRVRFQWAGWIFDGVMSSMSEDVDFFSSGGVPLRSKVSISIDGEDGVLDPGDRAADGDAATTTPGGGAFGAAAGVGLGMSASFGMTASGRLDARLNAGGGIGAALSASAGANLSASVGALGVGVALDGESPPAFAARMGLDPAAWRALAVAGGVQLSLAAGAEIAFPRQLGAATGIGSSLRGASASARATLEGIDGPATALSARAATSTGFALAQAGGVDAALRGARQARAEAASGRELRAFGMRADAPGQASATVPARLDERATSYGQGVPLRPRPPVAGP